MTEGSLDADGGAHLEKNSDKEERGVHSWVGWDGGVVALLDAAEVVSGVRRSPGNTSWRWKMGNHSGRTSRS